jgi:alkylhydroperoxidase family enzyme
VVCRCASSADTSTLTLLHDGEVNQPRLAPVVDPSSSVTELYERAGLRAPDGTPLNIFSTIAHHPDLLRRWLVFAAHVLAKSTLTARDRELLILRTGWRCRSQYEFSQHAAIALGCDVTADEVRRTTGDLEPALWSTHDLALLRAADELHDQACISDATWQTLADDLRPEQLLDVIFTVGNYHTVAFAVNSCGVALDRGITPAL